MRHLYLLIAVCAGIAVVACDSDSPVGPPSSGAVLFSLSVAPGITATAVSPSEIDLSWPSSPSATGYQVVRSDNGATGNYSLIASTAANVARYADAGLTGSTLYCYEIRSFKTAGKNTTYSAYSAAVCATTPASPLTAPTDVDVVPFNEQYFVDPTSSALRISWKDNSSNEDGFRLERASTAAGPWTLSVTTPPNATSWHWASAREEQICFRVIAFTTAGAASPASPDCTTPPANPTNLVAKADGQSIALTWTDNSAAEDGYKVSRLGPDATLWIDIATLAANMVSYRDAGVTPEMTYTYRVQALKDGGSSDYSNESNAVISTTPPAAPLSASASYWVDGETGWLNLDISWTDESTNELGFRIESSTDGVSGWQTHSVIAANVQSIEDQLSLDPATPQSGCFRVVAFNGAGESIPSNVTCTEWGVPPTNLTATAVDQQSIDLKWTDNARFETGYMVFRSTTAYGAYYFVAEAPANATSYHDTGLTGGQEYWYFVASDFGGNSDIFEYSDRVSATTLSATGATQTSRTVINDHLTPIRIRGRPSLEELRARYRSAQTSTAMGAGGVTPRRAQGPVRKKPRMR